MTAKWFAFVSRMHDKSIIFADGLAMDVKCEKIRRKIKCDNRINIRSNPNLRFNFAVDAVIGFVIQKMKSQNEKKLKQNKMRDAYVQQIDKHRNSFYVCAEWQQQGDEDEEKRKWSKQCVNRDVPVTFDNAKSYQFNIENVRNRVCVCRRLVLCAIGSRSRIHNHSFIECITINSSFVISVSNILCYRSIKVCRNTSKWM